MKQSIPATGRWSVLFEFIRTIMFQDACWCSALMPSNKSKAVFIIFPKSRNTFQYPLSKRVCKGLSRVVAFIIDLSVSRVRVERKALLPWLRSCIAQFDPYRHMPLRRSVGDTLRLSSLQKRVSGSNAYQKGVSNPLIKTSFAFIRLQISPWKSFGNLNSTPEKWW